MSSRARLALSSLALLLPAWLMAMPYPLHVVNTNQLQTSTGCPMRLTGMDVDGVEWDVFGRGPWPNSHGGVTVTVNVAATVWGANFIRLPLCQDFWFGVPNQQSDQNDPGLTFTAQSYRAIVDAVVAECNDLNIYVDIDLHRSGNGTWGSAYQQWSMPDANSTAFWADVAARYANNPSVLFGLFNEPHPTTNDTIGGPRNWQVWASGGLADEGFATPGFWSLLGTVRSTGANNIVIIGGCNFAEDLSGVVANAITDTASGSGIMWDGHIYYGSPGSWENDFAPALQVGPILAGEFEGPQGEAVPGAFDKQVMSWLDGNNAENTVMSGSAWTMDVYPPGMLTLITDWNYTPSLAHGVPVMGWLTSTARANCMSYTPSPSFTASPIWSATPTATASPSPTPAAGFCPSVMVDDFNDLSRNGAEPARTNLMGGQWGFNLSAASASVSYPSPGANGTAYSAQMAGSVTSASGYAIYTCSLLASQGPVNIMAAGGAGLELWMYGDGNGYRVSVMTSAVSDYNYYGAFVTPTAGVWALYKLPFSSLTRDPSWGTQTGLPLNPDGHDVIGLQLVTMGGYVGSFSFGVDEIGFFCATPTPTASPSASPTPTQTASPSPTPTITPSPSATASATVSPTYSFTPTITASPTLTASATPGMGPNQIIKLVAAPNPGPTTLYVLLKGPADGLRLRAYSQALVCVGEATITASFAAGWNKAALPKAWASRLANGAYFLVAQPLRSGQAAAWSKPLIIYMLR